MTQQPASRQRKRPQDLTGLTAERLAAENAEALKARAGELSLLQAAAAEERDEVVDLNDARVDLTPAPQNLGVVEITDAVEVESPTRTFRVNTTLEDVTIGVGNHYTFETGRKYSAPKHVYDHLEEKGLIWH